MQPGGILYIYVIYILVCDDSGHFCNRSSDLFSLRVEIIWVHQLWEHLFVCPGARYKIDNKYKAALLIHCGKYTVCHKTYRIKHCTNNTFSLFQITV